MLVGHEVGHALYTPDEDWREEYDVSPQFVNIVEDARIEKLMKRRYAGIGKTFYRGYNELADEDFFCLENEDVNKMNLADRVNLYFKIGNFCDIYFREHDEMPIVRMIEGCETFADALLAAEVLYKFCKKESNEEQPNVNNSQKNSEGKEGPSQESKDTSNSHEDSQENFETSDNTEQKTQTTSSLQTEDDEPEVKTVDNLEDSLKELINETGKETGYYEIPKVNIETIVISNKTIHEKL